mgnify:CR=1 FL=1
MENILIVDDEKNYPPIIAAVLEGEGYETLTASSGHQAMEILKNSDVDLVLADLKMPAMNCTSWSRPAPLGKTMKAASSLPSSIGPMRWEPLAGCRSQLEY